MKGESHTYPPTAPPPYPGPPSGSNYPDPTSGQTYPNYPDYPMTNQPQVTVVHPQNATLIQGATVIPAVVIANNMGPVPSGIICRSCNQQIITRVERSPSMRTHLLALFLCILGCWPCVCIPYCVDSCNNAEHYCTNCNAYIGSYIG